MCEISAKILSQFQDIFTLVSFINNITEAYRNKNILV